MNKKVEELQSGDIIRLDERTTFEVKDVTLTSWSDVIFAKVDGYQFIKAGVCGPNYIQSVVGTNVEVIGKAA